VLSLIDGTTPAGIRDQDNDPALLLDDLRDHRVDSHVIRDIDLDPDCGAIHYRDFGDRAFSGHVAGILVRRESDLCETPKGSV
jgi:hypothetical protein